MFLVKFSGQTGVLFLLHSSECVQGPALPDFVEWCHASLHFYLCRQQTVGNRSSELGWFISKYFRIKIDLKIFLIQSKSILFSGSIQVHCTQRKQKYEKIKSRVVCVGYI